MWLLISDLIPAALLSTDFCHDSLGNFAHPLEQQPL
jgi:hypothetical protein